MGQESEELGRVLTLADFKAGARALDGVRLRTPTRGRGFTIHVTPDGVDYVPESSGHPRPDSWDRVETVLARFNQTGSYRAGEYHDLTYHASYVLAVIGHLMGQSSSAAATTGPVARSARRPAAETLRKPNQRVGSVSNAHVGRNFERVALRYFQSVGVELERDFPVELGLQTKKVHHFDLGSERAKVLVECKSHRWTEGDKVPSAKMTVWNEAMYYFFLAPRTYRKCFFVLHHRRGGSGESLLSYYLRMHAHLIPDDVEFFEWDEEAGALV